MIVCKCWYHKLVTNMPILVLIMYGFSFFSVLLKIYSSVSGIVIITCKKCIFLLQTFFFNNFNSIFRKQFSQLSVSQIIIYRYNKCFFFLPPIKSNQYFTNNYLHLSFHWMRKYSMYIHKLFAAGIQIDFDENIFRFGKTCQSTIKYCYLKTMKLLWLIVLCL